MLTRLKLIEIIIAIIMIWGIYFMFTHKDEKPATLGHSINNFNYSVPSGADQK
jgi:hypothetical protein